MLKLSTFVFITHSIWLCYGQQGDNNEGFSISAEELLSDCIEIGNSHQVIRTSGADECIPNLYSVVIPQWMAEEDVRGLFDHLANDSCQIERIFCSDLLVQVEMSVWSDETLNKIMDIQEVGFVQEVHNVSMASRTGDKWGLDRVNQRSLPLDFRYSPACEFPRNIGGVWRRTTGSYRDFAVCPKTPNVFIVDTGIAYNHLEFENRARFHYDHYGQGGWDYNGHGTHVAGIAGGTNFGVAPNVNLWSVRVLDSSGSGTMISVQQGLISILTNPRKPGVVNMSLRGIFDDPVGKALIDGIQNHHDIPVIAAAGNDASLASTAWPAKIESVVTVGATKKNDRMASFSNYGDAVNIFAPGVKIYSAYTTSQTRSDTYAKLSGTSMAAPHVTGVAALIKENLPHLRAREVAVALLHNSTKNKVSKSRRTKRNHLLYACIPHQYVSYTNISGNDYLNY